MKFTAEQQQDRAQRLAVIIKEIVPQVPADMEDAEKRLERIGRRIEKHWNNPVRKGYLATKGGREQLYMACLTYLEYWRIQTGALMQHEREWEPEDGTVGYRQSSLRSRHFSQLYTKDLESECLKIVIGCTHKDQVLS